MTTYEFKTLWAWCDGAANDEDFWRRFMAAITVYPADVRARLVRFACYMWYGVEATL